jgi:hypothetical protein
VLRILQESKDERFVPCRNVRFENNVIVYTKAVRPVANIGPDTRPDTFAFSGNTWYCSDAPDARPDLPVQESGGRYGVDPKLKLDASGFPEGIPEPR